MFIQQTVCEYWPHEKYCDGLVDILSLWPVMTILCDPDGQVEARRKDSVLCVLGIDEELVMGLFFW